MTTYYYCTPEWLAECAERAQENPKMMKALEKLTLSMAFRIKADPGLGIDQDIIFAAFGSKGKLERLDFISEAEAQEKAEIILAASPQQWTKLLRKESLFGGDVMSRKITIEKGSITNVIRVAPYSGTFVDALTQVDLKFPDEMSPDELEEYRDCINEFRLELGV
jgi:hypothetical protein